MLRKNQKDDGLSEQVLLAEYESVYRYALSICHGEAEAEDITQDTFLRAIKSKDGFEGNCSLYTWLCTIAKNLWINKCKKLGKEASSDELAIDIPEQKASIEQMLVQRDMSKYIHRILHTLDEPYKEVFSLRVFGELPLKDIADIFAKTESWARVTFHRAKKMIIEKLEKDGLL